MADPRTENQQIKAIVASLSQAAAAYEAAMSEGRRWADAENVRLAELAKRSREKQG